MLFVRLKQWFDKKTAVSGQHPSFPGTMNLQWLLFYHHYTKDKTALQHALLSINKRVTAAFTTTSAEGLQGIP